MAKSIKHINLYILCGLCILVLAYVYCTKSRESFKDLQPPKFCGSNNDGYGEFTAGYLKFIKDSGLGPYWGFTAKTKLSTYPRNYTETDCDRLGFVYVGGSCVELIDTEKNPDGSYKIIKENLKNVLNDKCKALNETSGSLRPECKIDDKVVGKQINGFSIKVKGKQVDMPGNILRVYTEEECKDLGGQTTSVISSIANLLRDKSNVNKTDLKKLTDQVLDSDEKEEYFVCRGSLPFSTVCIDSFAIPNLSSLTSSMPSFSSPSSKEESSSDSSFFGDIMESAKTRMKEWLGI